MSAKSTTALATRIANHAWRKDGKPEKNYSEPTSVGYQDYRRHALWVVNAMQEMGLTVSYPKRSAKATPQGAADHGR